eukprot:TRINITY_DN4543_c0_g1_i2.p2 TRINITY_DN4543_c0_g1~~TRINITY_DN4543_c0_g1_i2.p2  ORF type:complete len:181 (-),score=47.69 TRINITY_DN4543_c0_g1_i2:140-682(-)
MRALAETIKETAIVDEEDVKRTMERMAQGKFSLRDLRTQLTQMLSMPLEQMRTQMPTQFANMIPQGVKPEQQLKKYLFMMDSMTESELDNPKVVNHSRVERVARGSGCALRDVQAMMDMHKQFSKMGPQMSQFMRLSQGRGDPSAALRNLSSMLPPQARGSAPEMHRMMRQMQQASKADQ